MKRFFKWMKAHKGEAVALTACILLCVFLISLFISEVISPDEELRFKLLATYEERYAVKDTVTGFCGTIPNSGEGITFYIFQADDETKWLVPIA